MGDDVAKEKAPEELENMENGAAAAPDACDANGAGMDCWEPLIKPPPLFAENPIPPLLGVKAPGKDDPDVATLEKRPPPPPLL